MISPTCDLFQEYLSKILETLVPVIEVYWLNHVYLNSDGK
jgi:hypothetical protein